MRQRLADDRRDGGFGAKPEARLCEFPGCGHSGEHRAPKSRDALHEYRWFCLDHVREYNKAWNYFAGMTQAEIEAFQSSVCTWHRETWRPFTTAGFFRDFEIADDLGPLFRSQRSGAGRGRGEGRPRPPSPKDEALATLDLREAPVTLHKIKRRYKELAKRLHPDLTGGDPQAEERFKKVNQAYEFLLTCGYT